MAMRYCDSLGHLTTATGARKFVGYCYTLIPTTAQVTSTPSGGTGGIDLTAGWDSKGAYLSAANGSASGVRVYPGAMGSLPAAQSTWFVGARWKHNAVNTTANYATFFIFGKTSKTNGYYRINSNGTISYYRVAGGGSSGTLVATSTYALNLGVRYYIVFKPIIGVSGSCACRVDGTEVLSATQTIGDNRGGDTTADCDTFDISLGGASLSEFDDIVVWDESAVDAHGNPDPLTTWVGDLRVYPLSPTGAGATTTWAPSTGTNWSCVDDKSISDADYVSTASVGAIDTYGMEDLTGTVGAIYGVQLNVTAQKDQPDTRTLNGVLLPGDSGATDVIGLSQTLTTAWKDHRDIWGTNPFDGTVWTETDINALKCGEALES